MGLFHWHRWLRRWGRVWGVKARPRRAPRRRPRLEILEDRLAPATLTWNGSVDSAWGDSTVTVGPTSNWTNSNGTNTGAIPHNGDDLVFPAGAANLSNTNNISGLSVRSITFKSGSLAPYNISGNSLTVTGSITDQGATVGGNTLTLPLVLSGTVSVAVTQASEVLDLSGPISGGGGLTETGAGELEFGPGRGNSYTGTTQVNQGVLFLNKTNAVVGPLVIGPANGGTAASVNINTSGVTTGNVPVTVNSSGALDVNSDDTIGALTLNGGTVTIFNRQLDIGTVPNTLTLNGDVTTNASGATASIGGPGLLSLGASSRRFIVAHGTANPDLNVSVAVEDGASASQLVKAGAGRMVLSGGNSYTGGTDVQAGELNVQGNSALGAGSATVETGAALEVQAPSAGANLDITNAITLNGSGVNGAGALDNVSGSNTLAGDITLASNSAIGVNVAGDSPTLADRVTGPGGLRKVGPGSLALADPASGAAANSYGGGTQVDQGLLALVKAGAVPGDVTVGTGSAVTTAQVLLGADAATAATTAVTVNRDGLFAVGEDGSDPGLVGTFRGLRSSDTVASLALNGGTVGIAGPQGVSPASALALGGDVTANPSAATAHIQGAGTLALGGVTRTFTVASGATLSDSAAIADGSASAGLTKAGAGRLTLAGANSYTGTTQVMDGTLTLAAASAVVGPLVVGDAAALAQIAANNATASTVPVTVNATGELDVGAAGAPAQDTIGSLTLNGGTVKIAGAQGASPASVLTLGGDVTANAAAATATIQGSGTLALGGANRTFTVAGGGADPGLVVSAAIADGVPAAPGGNSAGGLTLTPAGTAAGFTLSTFATGFVVRSSPAVGPLSVVFPTSGGVLVDDDQTGSVSRFPTDADGQDVNSVPVTANYGFTGIAGITKLGSTLYAALASSNAVGQLNDDGTLNHVVASVPNGDGIAADPLNGHLFVSAFFSSIDEVDPVTGTATVFANVPADGLAFDPTTNTLYAAAQGDPNPNSMTNGHVLGFNAATGAEVFDSGFIPGTPDGTAVGAGALAGNLFVNTNGGTLIEVNLATHAQTLLALGGSRGDFVSVDPTNGTLFVTQSDRVLRLIPAAGGGFLGGSSDGLTKAGAGRMVVSGSNTYSGGTHVTAGELNVQSNAGLGSGPATVDAGTAVEVQAPGLVPLSVSNPLTLNGSGVGGTGALRNITGANALTGAITLATDSVIGVDAGGLDLRAQVTGPGGLTKVGTGSVTLDNPPSGTAANTYGGTTQVSAGLLVLAKAGAVPGALTVGTGTGTPAQALLTADAATAPATALTVNSDGLFAVGEDGSDPAPAKSFAGSHSIDTIASLTLMGGTVSIAGPQAQSQAPASVLNLGGDVTSLACTTTATIRGKGTLALGGANRTFTVADGNPDPDLVVSATIADGTAVSSAASGGSSSGSLTLTPAGMAAGFTLSTFSTGFSERGDGLGPLSVVFPASGGVLVDDDQTGNVSRFPTDADGQDVNSVPVTASFGFNQISGVTKLGNKLYAATANGNSVAQLNDDGTLNHVVASITNADGITADPRSGHLFVSAFDGAIFDVDPVAGTATVFANVHADGLSFDATTNTLYATGYNDPTFDSHIVGFNAATGAVVFDSGSIPGKPDGNAVGTGSLAGNLFVNTNAGTLVEINLATQAQTLIASGGSRGDFVSVDPTNGTLFVTQSTSLARLIPSSGGGFLGGSPSGLTKAGPGRMVLGATNSYTGTTQVSAGTLTLAAPSAVIGPLVVGDAAALAQVVAAGATAPSVPVTVNATGELDVSANDTIGTLTLNGGTVKTTATLALGGDVTVNASSTTATITGSGSLSLGGPTRAVTVADGSADPDLSVSATVKDGASASELVKAGAGRMVLSGRNTYTGGTDVQAGETNLQNSAALGTGPATVETGAALEVQPPGATPLTVPNRLTLNGSGVGGAGALRNMTGANTWTGTITLASDSAVGVDAGTLDLRAQVSGPGGLTKAGPGRLKLDATDTYTGTTQVNAGTLTLAAASAVVGPLVVGDAAGDAALAQVAVNNATAPGVPVTVNASKVGTGSGSPPTNFGDIQAFYFAPNPFDLPDNLDGTVFVIENTSGVAITGGVLSINPPDDRPDSFHVGTIPAHGRAIVEPGISDDGGTNHTFFAHTGSLLDESERGPNSDNTQFEFTGTAGGSPIDTGIFTPAATRGPSNDGLSQSINFLGNEDGPSFNCFGPKVVATLTGTSAISVDLFYTRFGSGANIRKVAITYTGSNLTLGTPITVASNVPADGLLFAPNGLLVTANGSVSEVNPVTGTTTTVNGQGAEHLALDPSGTKIWSAPQPGPVLEIPLNPFGNAVSHALQGDDTAITAIAFDNKGNAYYTHDSSPFSGGGSFGLIDLTTFTTKRIFSSLPAAHGISFDPLTGDLFLFGGNHLTQIDPTTLKVVSDRAFPSPISVIDQGALDGAGHVYAADNGGDLAFVDYSKTGLVGDPSDFTSVQFLDSTLDDVAPLSGLGAPGGGGATSGVGLEVGAPGAPAQDTIASLTLNGGLVTIAGAQGTAAASVLTLGGDVTANASAVTATIQGGGKLSLGGATRTFTVADGSPDPDLTVSATITDGGASAGLTKAGPGRMVLAATNSYTGTTQVNAGILTLAAPSAVNGPLVVGDAAGDTPARAQITADNATNPTAAVMVNSSGELGVGTAGVASNQDTVGPLTLNGGAVFIAGAQGSTAASILTLGGDVNASGSTGLIGGGGTLSLGNAPRTITVAAGGTLGIDTPVDGTTAATLTKAGPGTLALQTDNTYHGLTVVANGVLDVESALALGDPAAGTSVSAGATLAVVSGPHANGVANIPEPLTLNGPGFGGSAALVSSFLGSLFPNSWAAPITLNADSAIEADDPLTVKGLISGPGGLIVRGTQALTLAGTGNNSYRGTTVVDGGDLQLEQSGIAVPGNLVVGTSDGKSSVCDVLGNEQIARGVRVTVNADGVLGINGNIETIGSLIGAGEVVLNNSPSGGLPSTAHVGTLVLGGDNSSTTYAGSILGRGGNVVKVGSGVVTLVGNSTYTGTTTVNGGTLRVDGSIPGSPVVVNAGGTLGGHGTVGPITVNGGTVAPGDSPGVLSVHGGATFNPGSSFFALLDGPAAGSDYSQLSVAGPVVLNGPALRLSFGFSPPRGQDFVLIANNGSGPVSGTFAGIPEDALLAHVTDFFDVSYAGGRGGDVDLLTQSRGDLFVRALFADFGALSSRTTRGPFEEQVAGGASRLSVARDFLSSPARRQAEVNKFYAAFGQADDGLQGRYVAQLLAGVPAGQVLINFLTSPSFRRHHHGNAAFVRALFTGLLGHPPGRHDHLGHQPPGFYVQELNAGAVGRDKLVLELLSSDEVYRAAVEQNFQTFLGMKPPPAQLQTLTGQLPSGVLNPDALSESIVALDAYIDFFITRAAANRAPGVVLVNG
jgi:autotransporter-associated beta strand protein